MKRKLIFLLIFVLLFAYVIVRAAVLGITYDEAWTLGTFVPLNLIDIFLFNPADANNQLLNTVLIKVCFIFGNHSLFIARLPNVMAFVVYTYFAYRMTEGSRNYITGFFLFILLLFNPFVLDFFSLARGYGLAMAFQMGALYFIMIFANQYDWKKLAVSLLFAKLAVVSNFTFLYFFLTVIVIGTGSQIIHIRENKNIGKVMLTASVAIVVLAAMVALPLLKLADNGGLYYGGTNGFYHDTLVSLFAFSIYQPYDADTARRFLNVFLILLGAIIVYSFIRPQGENGTFLEGKTIMICLLTGTAIIINLLNHYITGTLYLTDRTALFYIPLLIILLMYWIEELQSRKVNWIPSVLLISLCILFIVNFGIHANFKKTIAWPFDAHTEKILERIDSIGSKENKVELIDFSWPFESSVNYYLNKKQYANLKISKDISDREKLNAKADFYIYYDKSMDKVGYFSEKQPIVNLRKDTLWSYKDEDVYVFINLDSLNGGRK